LPFSNNQKGTRYSARILFEKAIQDEDFRSRPFIFQSKQYHAFVEAAISIDFVPETLVICDQDPILIKRFHDDAVIVHTSGFVEYRENVMILIS
jgi:hypothetical protein